MNRLSFLILLFLFFLNACSKDEKEVSSIKESKQALEMVAVYKEAYLA